MNSNQLTVFQLIIFTLLFNVVKLCITFEDIILKEKRLYSSLKCILVYMEYTVLVTAIPKKWRENVCANQ
jgi:hypothetical protein